MSRTALHNAIVKERLLGVGIVGHFHVSEKGRTCAAARFGHVRLYNIGGTRSQWCQRIAVKVYLE